MKTRHIFISAVLAIVMIVSCCVTAVASVPKPSESFYVYDEADVISEESEKHIISQNKKLEQTTGAQIVIAAIKTTGDESIKDYAGKLYTEWGIGDSDKMNGLLILLVIDDDNYWIMQGTGIDDELTSKEIKALFDNYLEPYFKEKDYDRGAITFFNKLLVEFEKIYDIKLDNITEAEEEGGIGTVILIIFIILLAVAVLGFVAFVVVRNMAYNKYRTGGRRPSVKIPPGARGSRPPQRSPNGAVPRLNSPAPRQNGTMPRQNGAMPRQNGAMPRQNGAMPRQNGAMPRQNGAMPRQNGTMPRQNNNFRN